MPRPYTPYIPQEKNELIDLLGGMMLSSPTFVDPLGYWPERNIDTEFFALNEGLQAVRKRPGEEKYQALIALSNRMRAHFEADPEDQTEDSDAGRQLIMEMQAMLRSKASKTPDRKI